MTLFNLYLLDYCRICLAVKFLVVHSYKILSCVISSVGSASVFTSLLRVILFSMVLGTPVRDLSRTERPSYVEYLLCNSERDIHKAFSAIKHIRRVPNSFWRVMYCFIFLLLIHYLLLANQCLRH